MPNIPYNYDTLNAIGWPVPAAPVAPGVTTCGPGSTAAGIAGLPNPLVVPGAAVANAVLANGVYLGGALSVDEMAWRTNAIRTAVTVAGGNMVISPTFPLLDPTEKTNLSFHVGNMCAAVVAQFLPLLPGPLIYMLFRRFQAVAGPGAVAFVSGLRPNYISFTALPTFQIWQAIGRTQAGNGLGARRGGFSQTLAVGNVFGAIPDAYIASLAIGNGVAGAQWRIRLTDPGQGAVADVPPRMLDSLYREYYRPWIELLGAGDPQKVRYAGAEYNVVAVPEADLRVGLNIGIQAILAQSGTPPGQVSKEIVDFLQKGVKNEDSETQYANRNALFTEIPGNWLVKES